MPTAPGPRANIVCVGGFRAPRKPCLRGWNLGGGCRAPRDGGWGYESRVTSNSGPHRCHCEGVRSTLKTLAYACGNPGIICLRAFARSAFLFTGSPRSFHSLAMTKGTKWIIPQSLTTPPQPPTRHVARGPGIWAPLQWRGNLARDGKYE